MQKLLDFFKESWIELKKVSWPSIGELQESTRVVIITSVLVSIYITIFDRLFGFAMRWLLSNLGG